MGNEALINRHYGFGGIIKRIEDALNKAGKDTNSLSVEDLAPVDEFHTRGREATLELADLGNISASDHVLDIGCGLGGTARHLAHEYGCQVTGIDLTEEYIDVGDTLTSWVGLDQKIKLQQASALELPFEDNTFDIAWTEHVQMNIADKKTFYSEASRVLKPGGVFLFHDIFRSTGQEPVYPAPWAEDASISHLALPGQVRTILEETGLSVDSWDVKDEESLAFFKSVLKRIGVDGPPPLGIHLLMGDNARSKIDNYVQNLSEQRLCVVMGKAHKLN